MNLIVLNPAFVYSNRVQWFSIVAYVNESDPKMLDGVSNYFYIWQEMIGTEDVATRMERASHHEVLGCWFA